MLTVSVSSSTRMFLSSITVTLSRDVHAIKSTVLQSQHCIEAVITGIWIGNSCSSSTLSCGPEYLSSPHPELACRLQRMRPVAMTLRSGSVVMRACQCS